MGMKAQWILGGLLALALSQGQAQAQDLYLRSCALCHGVSGNGKSATGRKLPGRPLGDLKDRKLEDLIRIVQDGKGAMPGFRTSLEEAQIRALLLHRVRFSGKR